MRKLVLISSVVLVALLMQFCGARVYTNPVFTHKTEGHREIAIVPFQMVFTGKQPKKLTPQQVDKIEEVESIAFQRSLYHSLFRQTTKYRHPVVIDIQPTERTNRLLEREGIGIRESWDMESVELARLLHVDAVVRARVIKRRYMSDLASFGVEVGNVILNAILEDTPLWIFLPNRTKRIKAECHIHNGRDGAVLWGYDIVDETDWRMPANDIIDGVNRHIARNFPYR